MEQDKKELCTIRIMFPVDSDEQAIELKKKIQSLFPNDVNVHFHFEITSMPVRPPTPRA